MHTAAHSLVAAVLTLTLCAAVGIFVPQAFLVFEPGFLAVGFMTGPKASTWAAFVVVNVGIWWAAYAAVLAFLRWIRSPVDPAESNSAHDQQGG